MSVWYNKVDREALMRMRMVLDMVWRDQRSTLREKADALWRRAFEREIDRMKGIGVAL